MYAGIMYTNDCCSVLQSVAVRCSMLWVYGLKGKAVFICLGLHKKKDMIPLYTWYLHTYIFIYTYVYTYRHTYVHKYAEYLRTQPWAIGQQSHPSINCYVCTRIYIHVHLNTHIYTYVCWIFMHPPESTISSTDINCYIYIYKIVIYTYT